METTGAKRPSKGLQKIGHVALDSGLMWIGDPCRVMGGKRPVAFGADWPDFCEKLKLSPLSPLDAEISAKEMTFHAGDDYEEGDIGLGVLIGTSHDDSYDVFAEFEDGLVTRVIIELRYPPEPEYEDEDEDEDED
jgi:hypothetical protein